MQSIQAAEDFVSSDGDCGIDGGRFGQLARAYCRRWGVGLAAVAPDGAVVRSAGGRGGFWRSAGRRAACQLAVNEALRWGEPSVELAAGDLLIWAVPLMHNALLAGGLVAAIEEAKVFPRGILSPAMDIRGAMADLLLLAERHNLTNAALLETRRRDSQRERARAEAIHAFKASPHYDLRSLYLLEEPLLIAAIRRGDSGEARAILNRLLVGMIHRAGDRLDLAKSFFMELVAMMSRTAVEAGGVPEALLGGRFDALAELSGIDDEERLTGWLRNMLERIMASLRRHADQSNAVLLSNALRFMAEHCCGDIRREDAAAAAAMSPSHFSRQFRRHFDRSFTDALNEMRTGRVAELLLRSDKPLKLIALECGFADQSYMTKVFRRRHGVTPARYRSEHQITKP